MLDAGQRAIAERHLELGCIAAVIETPEGASPLILRAIRRRGLEVGQVIFAASRAAVIRALPSLMRFLIRRGMPVAWIDAPAGLCPAGAHFRAGQKRFHTGGLPADRLDYAYSEFVIFGV